MAIVDKYDALRSSELVVTGRLVDASNATLYSHVVFNEIEIACIYKPVAGERPLWDFVDGCLANREVAAFEVSQSMGFNIVPFTIFRDGPYGVGMVQEWIPIDESIDLGQFFATDHPRLRVMALFDAIINNTDRKIGHLLPIDLNLVYGCDHGVTFHTEDKLRTVLWQWAGDQLSAQEFVVLEKLLTDIAGDLGEILSPLITSDEIKAISARVKRMLHSGRFPEPNPDWPAVPWPAF
jgi:uncharacterized repeat protein (TIGR03843 family)